jgi:hypothetical protein
VGEAGIYAACLSRTVSGLPFLANSLLREINRNLPFDIQMIHCTLDELADNCRLITKNQFKKINLKEL